VKVLEFLVLQLLVFIWNIIMAITKLVSDSLGTGVGGKVLQVVQTAKTIHNLTLHQLHLWL
jgi:hypothetical protein